MEKRNIERGRTVSEDVHVKAETQGQCPVKLEDWSDAFTNQGVPKIPRKPPKARKRQRRISPQFSERKCPCHHLKFRLLAFIILTQ